MVIMKCSQMSWLLIQKKVQTMIVKHLELLAEKINFYFLKYDLQPINWK